jgi:hypothetical protein
VYIPISTPGQVGWQGPWGVSISISHQHQHQHLDAQALTMLTTVRSQYFLQLTFSSSHWLSYVFPSDPHT